MTRSLKIAGVERWSDYVRDTLQIEKALTYMSDACSFELRGVQPNEYDTVLMSDSELAAPDLFGGLIQKVAGNTKLDKSTEWAVDCDDYTAQLARAQVVEDYTGYTAENMLIDIITKYVDTGFTYDIGTGSPTIERMIFNYVSVPDAIKKICDYIAWSWLITPGKVITVFNPLTLLTPAPITIEAGAMFTNLKTSVDVSSLANRVRVLGGKYASGALTWEFPGDGVSRQWPIPFDVVDITSISVGGVAATIGIDGVDDESTVDFIYSADENNKFLKCSSGTGTPADGATVSAGHRIWLKVIVEVDDAASQAAIAAIQGNDGVYQHTMTDTNLITIEAAKAAGNAYKLENSNPKVTGSFDTTTTGWVPGQIITFDLAARGISGEYMVQKVVMRPRPISGWDTSVTFGGRLLGVADWLAALVSDQRNKEVATTEVLYKYLSANETITITDVLTLTPRTTPYVIEASQEGVVSTV